MLFLNFQFPIVHCDRHIVSCNILNSFNSSRRFFFLSFHEIFMKIKFKLAPNLLFHNYVQDILLSHQNAFPYGTHTYSFGTQRKRQTQFSSLCFLYFFFLYYIHLYYTLKILWHENEKLYLLDRINQRICYHETTFLYIFRENLYYSAGVR